MLIAAATNEATGRKQFVIGLHQENIDRLLNDEPIRKALNEAPQNVPGLEDWDLVILGPEDLVRFMAAVGA